MPYVLALDQGTTSSRAIVFDAGRRDRRHRPARVPPDLPAARLGRARPAGDLGSAARRRPRGARAAPASRPRDIAAIGITNQRETTVVWDRSTGEPIYNAIVWQDRRTADLCDRLKRAGPRADSSAQRTGLVIDAYFSGTKLAWILDNVPGARDRAEARRAGLRHRRHLARSGSSPAAPSTSPTSPTPRRTMLFNIHTGDWDDELLAAPRHPARDAARGRALERSLRRDRARPARRAACPSPASPATSRPRSSARPASRRAWPRTPTAPAASCCMNIGDQPVASAHRLLTTVAWQIGGSTAIRPRRQRLHRRRRRAVAARRPGHHRDRRPRSKRSPRPCPTPAASTSCPPSPASARPTGIRTPAAPSSASPAAPPPPTSPAPRSKASPSRVADVARRHAGRLPASPLTELRVDGGAAANDLLMQFQADLLGVPVVAPDGDRDDRPRRRLPGRARRRLLEGHRGDRASTGRSSGVSSPRMPATRPRPAARAGTQALDRAKGWEQRAVNCASDDMLARCRDARESPGTSSSIGGGATGLGMAVDAAGARLPHAPARGSTTSPRGPPAGAPSWSTAACATSQQGEHRAWSSRPSTSAACSGRTPRTWSTTSPSWSPRYRLVGEPVLRRSA